MKARSDPSTKPYYKCLSCPRFRKVCGGIPTREMSLPEWCEYILDVMYRFHLTNAQVAEGADVSVATMEKISAKNCKQDFMRGTTRRVEQFVLGSVGNHTCYHDYCDETAADRIVKLEAELAEVKKDLAREREDNDLKTKIMARYMS